MTTDARLIGRLYSKHIAKLRYEKPEGYELEIEIFTEAFTKRFGLLDPEEFAAQIDAEYEELCHPKFKLNPIWKA